MGELVRDAHGKFSAIDRDVLHALLWDRARHDGTLALHQAAFAEELGVTRSTMSHIISEMVDAGRLRRLAVGQQRRTTYVVVDPLAWRNNRLIALIAASPSSKP